MLIFVINKHSNDLHIPHEQVFKDEIEKADQPGGPILDPQESKSIFGGLVPIYDVHVKIRDELAKIVSSSSTHWSIGSAFLKHVCHCCKFSLTFYVCSVCEVIGTFL